MNFVEKRVSHKLLSLLFFFKSHKKKALIGGVFMLINVVLLLPTPLLTMYLIDKVLPQKDIFLLCIISILAIVVIIISSLFGSLQQVFFQKFNECVVFKIQVSLFQKVQSLPYSQRKKMETGYLMARVIDDPERIHSLLVETLFSIIKDILTLAVGFSLVFFIHWKLACISIVLLPIYAYILTLYNKKIRNVSTDYYENRAQVSKKIQESLSLHDLFTLFNAHKYDTIKLVKLLKESIKKSIYRTYLVSVSSALIGIVSSIGPIFVIWYGIYEIIHGNLTLGELIAFNTYLGYLFGPTSRLIKVNLNIQQSMAAWDRIYSYITMCDNELQINKSRKIIKNIDGNITFNNISFSYENEQILKDINFTIPLNSTVAILGESGCGKTTLASLLSQFNTNYSGEILVGSVNIKEYNLTSLRNQIAVVNQEPSLFHNTIYNNIQIGNNTITYDKIIQACKIVNIHDFITSLPDKYNTIVDERASNLSVGQKQRIAIARAIVRDPKILILDEPTSNLDAETERLIYNSLNDFVKTRTTIVITHKVAIDLKFDSIITLKDKTIVESGNPDDLIKDKNSMYSKLINNSINP